MSDEVELTAICNKCGEIMSVTAVYRGRRKPRLEPHPHIIHKRGRRLSHKCGGELIVLC